MKYSQIKLIFVIALMQLKKIYKTTSFRLLFNYCLIPIALSWKIDSAQTKILNPNPHRGSKIFRWVHLMFLYGKLCDYTFRVNGPRVPISFSFFLHNVKIEVQDNLSPVSALCHLPSHNIGLLVNAVFLLSLFL